MKMHTYKKGFTLIEVVVGSAVCLVVLVGLLSAFTVTLKLSLANTSKVQASFLEEEGLEAVRILRDNGWNTNIASQSSGVPFYLTFSGGTWQVTTTNIYIDGIFERKITLTNVYRGANQDIVSSGGVLDAKTRKATVSVAWSSGGATTTKSISTYFTNIFNN
ncbi:MAG: prepilin-type N-terminal cleavage/methylation domain-containing protein [Candidatus Zambryskibacteria bacterium]|nr:prepilin-type N-terminal cleavage/methylation domain-containing protein [Candidatus Zambryskibacteria bacterium]